MKVCQCRKRRLTIREGRSFCLNCERIDTRVARVPGAPLIKTPVPVDHRGRPMKCHDVGTVAGALSAIDEHVARGGDQNDGERLLRQHLCGPYTPKKVFDAGMQAGLTRLSDSLDARDLPSGMTVTKKRAEKTKTPGRRT